METLCGYVRADRATIPSTTTICTSTTKEQPKQPTCCVRRSTWTLKRGKGWKCSTTTRCASISRSSKGRCSRRRKSRKKTSGMRRSTTVGPAERISPPLPSSTFISRNCMMEPVPKALSSAQKEVTCIYPGAPQQLTPTCKNPLNPSQIWENLSLVAPSISTTRQIIDLWPFPLSEKEKESREWWGDGPECVELLRIYNDADAFFYET